nr:hypothetical protein [Paraburkholderia panacisoli]
MRASLLQDGDVYGTDWANARDVPLAAGRFGLDDYVLAVERFMRQLGCAHTETAPKRGLYAAIW